MGDVSIDRSIWHKPRKRTVQEHINRIRLISGGESLMEQRATKMLLKWKLEEMDQALIKKYPWLDS